MKKFAFSLDTVHRFKAQILDSLLNEMGAISAQILRQERTVENAKNMYLESKGELNDKNKIGSTILEIKVHQEHIKKLQRNIDQEIEKLEALYKLLEEKKLEVIEAKKENMSLDKLREKKLWEYNKLVTKNEEMIVEEFVVNTIVSGRNI